MLQQVKMTKRRFLQYFCLIFSVILILEPGHGLIQKLPSRQRGLPQFTEADGVLGASPQRLLQKEKLKLEESDLSIDGIPGHRALAKRSPQKNIESKLNNLGLATHSRRKRSGLGGFLKAFARYVRSNPWKVISYSMTFADIALSLSCFGVTISGEVNCGSIRHDYCQVVKDMEQEYNQTREAIAEAEAKFLRISRQQRAITLMFLKFNKVEKIKTRLVQFQHLFLDDCRLESLSVNGSFVLAETPTVRRLNKFEEKTTFNVIQIASSTGTYALTLALDFLSVYASLSSAKNHAKRLVFDSAVGHLISNQWTRFKGTSFATAISKGWRGAKRYGRRLVFRFEMWVMLKYDGRHLVAVFKGLEEMNRQIDNFGDNLKKIPAVFVKGLQAWSIIMSGLCISKAVDLDAATRQKMAEHRQELDAVKEKIEKGNAQLATLQKEALAQIKNGTTFMNATFSFFANGSPAANQLLMTPESFREKLDELGDDPHPKNLTNFIQLWIDQMGIVYDNIEPIAKSIADIVKEEVQDEGVVEAMAGRNKPVEMILDWLKDGKTPRNKDWVCKTIAKSFISESGPNLADKTYLGCGPLAAYAQSIPACPVYSRPTESPSVHFDEL